MTFQVFQVDPGTALEPFAEERIVLEAVGGSLVFGKCRTEDEIIERAGQPDVLWLIWRPNISRQVLEALPSVRPGRSMGRGFRADRCGGRNGARHGGRERHQLWHG